jgi:hypothetical protein
MAAGRLLHYWHRPRCLLLLLLLGWVARCLHSLHLLLLLLLQLLLPGQAALTGCCHCCRVLLTAPHCLQTGVVAAVVAAGVWRVPGPLCGGQNQ